MKGGAIARRLLLFGSVVATLVAGVVLVLGASGSTSRSRFGLMVRRRWEGLDLLFPHPLR